MFTNRCTWLLTSEVEVGGEREGKGGVMAEVGEGGREGGRCWHVQTRGGVARLRRRTEIGFRTPRPLSEGHD